MFYCWILLSVSSSKKDYTAVPESTGSASTDQKYSEKKIPESSKKQNLNLSHAYNYLHIIYIEFTTTAYP